MGIFDEGALTKQERVAAIKKQILESNARGMSALLDALKTSFELCWCLRNDPANADITPKDIFDAFGRDAVGLFIASTETQRFIKSLNPNFTPVEAPYNFMAFPDGTVQIGDPK